jgi:ribonuclease T2
MGVVTFALLLALACVTLAQVDPYGQAGVFDMYCFARTWTPEYCCGNRTSPECSNLSPSAWAQTNFALHGLWPQYLNSQDNHQWPQFCGGNNFTFFNFVQNVLPGVTSEFMDQWTQYAPAYAWAGLAGHEWQRHGTCYSSAVTMAASSITLLTAAEGRYFTNQLRLMTTLATPAAIQSAQSDGRDLSLHDIQAAFGGADMVALGCVRRSGRIYLSDVTLCFDKDTLGNPTNQIACPENVQDSTYDNNCVTDDDSKIYITRSCS